MLANIVCHLGRCARKICLMTEVDYMDGNGGKRLRLHGPAANLKQC